MGSAVVNEPRQQRSRETLERVLAAGEELLLESGLDGFTISEIARRAGLSPGAIYGRFTNKDALLHLIHERLLDGLSLDLDEQVARVTSEHAALQARIVELTTTVAACFREQAVLLRIFFTLGGRDSVITSQGGEWMLGVSRRLLEALAECREQIRHPAPDRALSMSVQTILGACMRGVTLGHAAGPQPGRPTYGLDWPATIEELPRMCTAYLLAD